MNVGFEVRVLNVGFEVRVLNMGGLPVSGLYTPTICTRSPGLTCGRGSQFKNNYFAEM